ncbi:hypothetical protein ACUUYQ_14695 [Bacillus halotolerans]|uniref:hypothetical protein n=1 Tax=Bacillus TaxID=1386 RepID=UPI000D04757A|nr:MULTISPECIES: hypothetical protein [Bacillus]MBV7321164.1 hypothetical protein [Halalkalibacterium halodurans]AZV49377.1 hypothetical protein DIC78_10410 [Bacillus halotolerans]MCP9301208.1 hypothetical protein [Bacillus halotolerans]MCV0026721.1 hypothetical protein [Bacillus sp. XT-2]PRS07409.1 hypothetical protein C6W26_05300 [Bacillus halotolerans]
MIKIKPSKVIIISLSKKQLKEFLFFEIIIGSTGYWIFKYKNNIFFECTGLAASILCPLLFKKMISKNKFKFKKNHIITVR